TAADFGVIAQRLEKYPGVWVQTPRGWEKLGALGINLKRWISTHGIAFNLDPHMPCFQWITPCGITDMGVCSLRSLLGDGCPCWDEACTNLIGHLSEILAFDMLPTFEPSKSVSVTVWRQGATGGPEILMMLRCPSKGQWWSSVTGMIEDGETPEMAAHREVLEEAGLVGKLVPLGFQHSFWIDPALSGVRSDEPLFNTEICFQMEVPADRSVALNSAEHSEYRWCKPDEALALMKWEGSKEALALFLKQN
ncbi:MAG: NUDIX domain-containing protein, partial [Holophagales bacterium]|nr:NUDIX domain-containing protein [Holophagales bacterium]